MNREQAKQYLPLITALAEGKEIECRAARTNDKWRLTSNPQWFDSVEYRIKPEPKSFWISEFTWGLGSWQYPTEASAILKSKGGLGYIRTIKFVEATE